MHYKCQSWQNVTFNNICQLELVETNKLCTKFVFGLYTLTWQSATVIIIIK